MVKKIMRNPLFLTQKSTDATEADQQVITDLLDTLRANLDHCVGMAANMIGVKKNIIVVAAGPFQFAMVNPVITKKTGAFQTEEGCLSLEGVRPCTRYKEIEVEYITDMEKVMAYGVMSMPAIVVNETVASMGKVLKSAEVIKLFGKLGF